MKVPGIELELVCRPCLVNNEKALFHMWTVDEQLYLAFDYVLRTDVVNEVYSNFKEKHLCDHAAHIEKTAKLFGLVEYEDGTVDRVIPEHICFLDSKEKFDQFCWEKGE